MKKRITFLFLFFVGTMLSQSFITTWKTDNAGISNSNQITIPTNGNGYNYSIDWENDGIIDNTNVTGTITHTYATAGTYTVAITGNFPRIYFNNTGDQLKILSVEQWGSISWRSFQNSFYGCSNLVINAADTPNLTLVSNMANAFRDATSLNQNLDTWDVSNVTNMSNMFNGATNFNVNISNWDVSNVVNMSNMFNGATSFNRNINGWNVSNVINMAGMFRDATSFDRNLGGWNVANVTNMASMFYGATVFNRNIGGWDVSSVTLMNSMLRNAPAFDQNLGNWNVSNVTNMNNMLRGSKLSDANYDSLLAGWSALSLQPNISFHAGNSEYCASAVQRQSIITDFNWTINDAISATCASCATFTTWDGSAWSNGTPNITTSAIFTGNYNSFSNLTFCSITVQNNANVTITAGNTFTVEKAISVTSGSLIVENYAAIVQNDVFPNSGNIIVKRNSTPMIRLDYTAWSSPVVGQQLLAFSPNTVLTRFYEYLYTGTTTATSYQTVDANTNFVPGKGYLIRVDNTWPTSSPAVYNGVFTGVPNNGDYTAPIGIGFNLIGNPYPSPINSDTFLVNNPGISTLYFWTHTVAANASGIYPQSNYASYTTLGGTAAAAGGNPPVGFVQTGQGFYVNSSVSGSAVFNNAQRVPNTASNQFFKNASNTVVDKHRIWLSLKDASNNYNQILVGYMDGATNAVDTAIDGKVLETNNTILYNLLDSEAYVIQGRQMPFSDNDEVLLGFKALTAGTYTIDIDDFDGLFLNQDVFINDKFNNTIHNLKVSPYTFTTAQGDFTSRFSVVYKNTALSNQVFESNSFTVLLSANNEIQFLSTQTAIDNVRIYDLSGRLLIEKNNVNDTNLTIMNNFNTSVLLVKTTLNDGKVEVKKLINN
ncbi:BspA family leucine-rich repeat surface protein [Flavobacterium ponti]|uniref:BspA family leucine-rich repeat surface protein n=1 Tax=Flavobacterium ponti TaxID=665133 RepID=A0ABV9P4D6_9FLAO